MAYELKDTEVDKKGALEILDVSERTLANYLKDERLQARYEKGKTSKIAVFQRTDVEVLKAELNDPTKPANTAKPVKGVEVESGASREHSNSANPATNARDLNPANNAALAKVENSALYGTGSMAEFSANLAARFAAAINESAKIQNLAVQPLLTFADAALFTGLSERSLRLAAKEGKLIARRQGRADRILRSDLDKYLIEIQK